MKETTALALLAGFCCSGAAADPVVYTDRASWEAAVGGDIMTEDFAGAPVGPISTGVQTVGVLEFYMEVLDGSGYNEIRDGGAVNGSRGFRGRVSNAGANVGGSFSDDIPTFVQVDYGDAPLTAFGADYSSTTSGAELQITLQGNGATIVFADYLTSGSGSGFLGIIDEDGFDSVWFEAVNPTSLAELWDMDNVSVAAGGDTACGPDLTLDGNVDTNDFFLFLTYYQNQDARADFSPGGGINTNDFFAFLAAYQLGC